MSNEESDLERATLMTGSLL